MKRKIDKRRQRRAEKRARGEIFFEDMSTQSILEAMRFDARNHPELLLECAVWEDRHHEISIGRVRNRRSKFKKILTAAYKDIIHRSNNEAPF